MYEGFLQFKAKTTFKGYYYVTLNANNLCEFSNLAD